MFRMCGHECKYPEQNIVSVTKAIELQFKIIRIEISKKKVYLNEFLPFGLDICTNVLINKTYWQTYYKSVVT